jgi:hypothetical protein
MLDGLWAAQILVQVDLYTNASTLYLNAEW